MDHEDADTPEADARAATDAARAVVSRIELMSYTDYSHLTPEDVLTGGGAAVGANGGGGGGGGGGRTIGEPPFPLKLHAILSDPDCNPAAIIWMPHGRAWKIVDQKKFEDLVLRKHNFRHCRTLSFMRQVTGWGFMRVNMGEDEGAYYHEYFLRGLPHICMKMQRKAKNTYRSAKASKQTFDRMTIAPDFRRISERHPLPMPALARRPADDVSAAATAAASEGPARASPSSTFAAAPAPLAAAATTTGSSILPDHRTASLAQGMNLELTAMNLQRLQMLAALVIPQRHPRPQQSGNISNDPSAAATAATPNLAAFATAATASSSAGIVNAAAAVRDTVSDAAAVTSQQQQQHPSTDATSSSSAATVSATSSSSHPSDVPSAAVTAASEPRTTNHHHHRHHHHLLGLASNHHHRHHHRRRDRNSDNKNTAMTTKPRNNNRTPTTTVASITSSDRTEGSDNNNKSSAPPPPPPSRRQFTSRRTFGESSSGGSSFGEAAMDESGSDSSTGRASAAAARKDGTSAANPDDSSNDNNMQLGERELSARITEGKAEETAATNSTSRQAFPSRRRRVGGGPGSSSSDRSSSSGGGLSGSYSYNSDLKDLWDLVSSAEESNGSSSGPSSLLEASRGLVKGLFDRVTPSSASEEGGVTSDGISMQPSAAAPLVGQKRQTERSRDGGDDSPIDNDSRGSRNPRTLDVAARAMTLGILWGMTTADNKDGVSVGPPLSDVSGSRSEGPRELTNVADINLGLKSVVDNSTLHSSAAEALKRDWQNMQIRVESSEDGSSVTSDDGDSQRVCVEAERQRSHRHHDGIRSNGKVGADGRRKRSAAAAFEPPAEVTWAHKGKEPSACNTNAPADAPSTKRQARGSLRPGASSEPSPPPSSLQHSSEGDGAKGGSSASEGSSSGRRKPGIMRSLSSLTTHLSDSSTVSSKNSGKRRQSGPPGEESARVGVSAQSSSSAWNQSSDMSGEYFETGSLQSGSGSSNIDEPIVSSSGVSSGSTSRPPATATTSSSSAGDPSELSSSCDDRGACFRGDSKNSALATGNLKSCEALPGMIAKTDEMSVSAQKRRKVMD